MNKKMSGKMKMTLKRTNKTVFMFMFTIYFRTGNEPHKSAVIKLGAKERERERLRGTKEEQM